MRKKMVTVLLALVMASSILGGCGKTQETSGKAEGTKQTRESEEGRKTQNDSDNEGAGILGFLGGDEPEKSVRSEGFELSCWWECEYDKSGNQTKVVYYESDGSISSWWEYEYDKVGNATKLVCYRSNGIVDRWYEFGYEYEYDKSGNVIKTSQYARESDKDRETTEFGVVTPIN